MLVEPTTAAVTEILTTGHNSNTIQLHGIPDVAIAIERPDGAGGWTPAMKDAAAVVLDADNTSLFVEGKLTLRINKQVTSTAVGIEVN